MDTYKLKWTALQNEIFGVLCAKAGTALNQREIARLLKVSPTAVATSVQKLKSENLITIKKESPMNLNSVGLNRDNPKAIALKRIENLKAIYLSGIVELLEDNFPGSAIVLFGSFSRGEDTENSDIDIAIIGAKSRNLDLTRFDKRLGRTITIHNYERLNNVNSELKSGIVNGIVLSGAIEL